MTTGKVDVYRMCRGCVPTSKKNVTRSVNDSPKTCLSKRWDGIQAVTASRSYYRTIDEYVTEYLPGSNGGEGAKGRKRAQKGARENTQPTYSSGSARHSSAWFGWCKGI